uniref:Uncharacterized protein MANES_01G206200 n=1 Tax=Rhizophora mucronata TaxID=61149 RepID=A0A2P2JAZ7_RHIMU
MIVVLSYGRRVLIIRMSGPKCMFLMIIRLRFIRMLGRLMDWVFVWRVVGWVGISLFLLHEPMVLGTWDRSKITTLF